MINDTPKLGKNRKRFDKQSIPFKKCFNFSTTSADEIKHHMRRKQPFKWKINYCCFLFFFPRVRNRLNSVIV